MGLKVKTVKISNFRNIENLEKELNGASILLIGGNRVGKSSFINAILAALGDNDALGINPVTYGKGEGHVGVIMSDNGQEYEFSLKIEEGKDKPTLTVKQPNGLRSSARSTIGAIVGSELVFDCESFCRLSDSAKGRKEQVEIFKSFLPEDLKETLRKHESSVKAYYDDRTLLNRDVDKVTAEIKASKITPDDKHKFFLKEDSSKIDAQMASAVEENETYQRGIDALKSSSDGVNSCNEKIATNIESINEYKKKIDALTATNITISLEKDAHIKKQTDIDKWLQENSKVDIIDLQAKSKAVYEHNRMHELVIAYIKKEEELEGYLKEVESMTVLIETGRQAISDAIKEVAQDFVPGVSFTEEHLLYNGVPIHASTISTAEKMGIGVRMRLARGNKTSVLFIERSESLDKKMFAALQELAKQEDFQIIAERVDPDGEELQIQFIPE